MSLRHVFLAGRARSGYVSDFVRDAFIDRHMTYIVFQLTALYQCDGATPHCHNCERKGKDCKYQHGDDKRKYVQLILCLLLVNFEIHFVS